MPMRPECLVLAFVGRLLSAAPWIYCQRGRTKILHVMDVPGNDETERANDTNLARRKSKKARRLIPQDLSSYSRVPIRYIPHSSSLVTLWCLVLWLAAIPVRLFVLVSWGKPNITSFAFGPCFLHEGDIQTVTARPGEHNWHARRKTASLRPPALRCLLATPHVSSSAVILTERVLAMSCSLITW